MFIAMLGSMSITTYVVGYLATYAQDALKMSARQGFGTTIAQGMCFMCVSPVSGWLSDRYRRKPVMLSALCVLLLSVVPCFMAMNAWRTEAVLFLSSALFTSCQQLLFVPILVMITECVPRSVRAGTLSMVYALAIALFGGSAQFIIKGLSDWTASPLAPAWYLTGALCVGGVAMIAVPMRRADHFH
jgi:MFS family permease